MKESNLRAICSKLGVKLGRKTHEGWIDGPCPFAPWKHKSGHDRNPSFGVKVEETGVSSYVCHSCKSHGTIANLANMLGMYRHADYHEIEHEARMAEAEGEVLPDFENRTEAFEPPPEPLEEAVYDGMFEPALLDPEARNYLAGRGITENGAERMGLLYDPDQKRVLFPVRDREGSLYGFTGRAVRDDIKPKVRDYAGLPKKHLILGEDRWDQDKPIIIVEGLFAYAHLVDMGVEKVANVGALMGSSMTKEKAERLRTWGNPVFLLLDNDAAGDVGIFGQVIDPETGERDTENSAVGLLCEHVPVFVPAWPEKKDDPDQLSKREVWSMLKDTPMYVQPVARKPKKK